MITLELELADLRKKLTALGGDNVETILEKLQKTDHQLNRTKARLAKAESERKNLKLRLSGKTSENAKLSDACHKLASSLSKETGRTINLNNLLKDAAPVLMDSTSSKDHGVVSVDSDLTDESGFCGGKGSASDQRGLKYASQVRSLKISLRQANDEKKSMSDDIEKLQEALRNKEREVAVTRTVNRPLLIDRLVGAGSSAAVDAIGVGGKETPPNGADQKKCRLKKRDLAETDASREGTLGHKRVRLEDTSEISSKCTADTPEVLQTVVKNLKRDNETTRLKLKEKEESFNAVVLKLHSMRAVYEISMRTLRTAEVKMKRELDSIPAEHERTFARGAETYMLSECHQTPVKNPNKGADLATPKRKTNGLTGRVASMLKHRRNETLGKAVNRNDEVVCLASSEVPNEIGVTASFEEGTLKDEEVTCCFGKQAG